MGFYEDLFFSGGNVTFYPTIPTVKQGEGVCAITWFCASLLSQDLSKMNFPLYHKILQENLRSFVHQSTNESFSKPMSPNFQGMDGEEIQSFGMGKSKSGPNLQRNGVQDLTQESYGRKFSIVIRFN